MEGVISNYRRSPNNQRTKHIVILVDGITDREKAKGLVGKAVTWESPAKKVLNGKVAAPHGNSGAIRAIFETGMPGQSLGTKVTIQ